MSGYPPLKKPKIEIVEEKEEEEDPEEDPLEEDPQEEEEPQEEETENGATEEQFRNEQEEAYVALVEHRTKEVEHLRNHITYYKSQLDAAQKRLEDTQMQLARLRRGKTAAVSESPRVSTTEGKAHNSSASPNHPPYIPQNVGQGTTRDNSILVKQPPSPNHPPYIPQNVGQGTTRDNHILAKKHPSSSQKSGPSQNQNRPKLVIPSLVQKMQPVKVEEYGRRLSSSAGPLQTISRPTHIENSANLKRSTISSEPKSQPKGAKPSFELREHKDLIPLINSSSSPQRISCQTSCFISCQHKRKLRSLVLCPTNDQLFATSALDGVINLWQIEGRGSGAHVLSSTDSLSDKRRWPEDVAWHPHGNKLFSVYSADAGDSQVSILNLNKGKERTRVNFLVDKPHTKGIINSISFMPWEDTSFVTGGSDHAVVLWTDIHGDDSWKPKPLHLKNHSSAVMGVSGMHHKKVVMSVGADKRIVGVDVETGRAEYRHQIDSKCMSVLTNPRDFNLFMVQTGTPERQLRLFDLRLRQMEVHSFGWKQESSESQSALINQAWSPDGLYLSSGSADPAFHIFDIRCSAHKPSQTVKAHQKRVFKAAWHHKLPIMISISSDLNIGLHRIT